MIVNQWIRSSIYMFLISRSANSWKTIFLFTFCSTIYSSKEEERWRCIIILFFCLHISLHFIIAYTIYFSAFLYLTYETNEIDNNLNYEKKECGASIRKGHVFHYFFVSLKRLLIILKYSKIYTIILFDFSLSTHKQA